MNMICCFCNKDINSDNINPCALNILINWDKTIEEQNGQTFWCHLECFRKSLHQNSRENLFVDLIE